MEIHLITICIYTFLSKIKCYKCKIRFLISTLFVLLAICSRICLKKLPVMENDLQMISIFF